MCDGNRRSCGRRCGALRRLRVGLDGFRSLTEWRDAMSCPWSDASRGSAGARPEGVKPGINHYPTIFRVLACENLKLSCIMEVIRKSGRLGEAGVARGGR